MNKTEFVDKLTDLRPRYADKYRDMIERISNKGERLGRGNVAQFGAFYQTYMYACMIGMRLGAPKYLDESATEFAPINKWRPVRIREFLIVSMLNRSTDYGYSWMDLEDASNETIDAFLAAFLRELNGYANRGLEYLQDKWNNQKIEFESPYVFVDILKKLETPA